MTTSAPITKPPLRRDQDVSFTRADFAQIADFMLAQTGIRLTEANERMVYARLCRRVTELGFGSFGDYVSLFTAASEAKEREFLISALTTNTTHFFRESYHFDFLKENVFPEMIARAEAGERIRIWSAACSSGEEAYSIALSLLQAFPNAHRHDVKILATDIDKQVLAQAQAGCYAEASLKELPRETFAEHFERSADGRHYTAGKVLKSLVTFRPLNLIGDWPFRGCFDVIFCRNVAIYMDLETQEKIWTGFQRVLARNGHLFIGHSERLSPSLKDSFKMVGKTIYQHIADPRGPR